MFSLLSLIILLLLDVPILQFSDFEISDNSCGLCGAEGKCAILRMQSWKPFIQCKTLETINSA